MTFSKKEIQALKKEIEAMKLVLKKMEEARRHELIRIDARRKSQLKGKRINRGIVKTRKPIREGRRVMKRRSAIR